MTITDFSYPNDENHNHDNLESLATLTLEKSSTITDTATVISDARGNLANYTTRATSGENPLDVLYDLAQEPVLDDLNATVISLEKSADSLQNRAHERSKKMERALANGETYPNAGEIYDLTQEALHINDVKREVSTLRDEHIDLLATLAKQATDDGHLDVISEYVSDTLGESVNGGYYENGTREWLEFRQNGMGASDVGLFTGVSPAKMEKLWESKVSPISDEQVASSVGAHEVIDDPLSRGHAFEEYTGALFAASHPDLTVMYNKDTWVKEGSSIQVNYDLLVDSTGDGTPDAPLEIKYTSSLSNGGWKFDKDGFDAIPPAYQAQLLTQMIHGGFEKGYLAVLIDGRELRSYEVEMTDDLRAYAGELVAEADEFYDLATKFKNGETDKVPESIKRNYDGGLTSINRYACANAGMNHAKDVVFIDVANAAGVDVSEVKQHYVDTVATTDGSPDSVRACLEDLYVTYQPRNIGAWVGIDLETTDVSETSGRIIETGISSAQVRYDELHGVDDYHLSLVGTGAVDVHGIEVSHIAGKPDVAQASGDIMKAILEGSGASTTLVAYNAKFEKQWLRGHVEGFAEAESQGRIKWVDAMNLYAYSDGVRKDRHKMQDMVENVGMEYVDAHRAINDVDMMMEALDRKFA